MSSMTSRGWSSVDSPSRDHESGAATAAEVKLSSDAGQQIPSSAEWNGGAGVGSPAGCEIRASVS